MIAVSGVFHIAVYRTLGTPYVHHEGLGAPPILRDPPGRILFLVNNTHDGNNPGKRTHGFTGGKYHGYK